MKLFNFFKKGKSSEISLSMTEKFLIEYYYKNKEQMNPIYRNDLYNSNGIIITIDEYKDSYNDAMSLMWNGRELFYALFSCTDKEFKSFHKSTNLVDDYRPFMDIMQVFYEEKTKNSTQNTIEWVLSLEEYKKL